MLCSTQLNRIDDSVRKRIQKSQLIAQVTLVWRLFFLVETEKLTVFLEECEYNTVW